MDCSELLATNVWKLFPFRSGNRVWVFILLKAYLLCVMFGFCLACILNAVEGNLWLDHTIIDGVGVKAYGDTALDECFWFVFCTMHGIGFGEFMARGVIGRLIAMFCCAIGYWFTLFMMSIIMMSQLPGEKAPSLCRVTARMVNALWPSYSVFLALVLAVGAVVGPYVSKDHEAWGPNRYPTGMYWAWTVVHRTPYGDIYPDTVFGRTVTVPLACMGVLYMPYALACIAVRCPTSAQHREIVAQMRARPEDALGCGYIEPPEAAGSGDGTLTQFVNQDGYAQDDEIDSSGERSRSCIAVCLLLTFTLLAMIFCGGPKATIQLPQKIEHLLELDLPPGIRYAKDPVPPVIWTFWIRDVPLDASAAREVKSMQDSIDTDVQLIDGLSLEQYNVTDWPYHEALHYLAPNHKLDYLQAYFMHHYGGGFMEIKEQKTNSTWMGAFDDVADNETIWFMGVPSNSEVACDEGNVKDGWCKKLQWESKQDIKYNKLEYDDMNKGISSWKNSEGPCCSKVLQYYQNNTGKWPSFEGYIFRKQTDLTKDWLELINMHLNAKLPVLKQGKTPTAPCCKDTDYGINLNPEHDYPLRFEELRGEILSVLFLRYAQHTRVKPKLL